VRHSGGQSSEGREYVGSLMKAGQLNSRGNKCELSQGVHKLARQDQKKKKGFRQTGGTP